MTLSYNVRLLCLCLASFFLVHLAGGLIVRLMTPTAIRIARRIRPRIAALCLLTLRLLPLMAALFAVAALCLPSYFWLEPSATTEYVGVACLSAALLGLACCAVAASRAVRAVVRSVGYVRGSKHAGRETRVQGETSPVWLTEETAPGLALIGIIRSRVIISQKVLTALSAEELAVALRHERAHRSSHDNLKRLVILLTPDLFPFVRAFRDLEHAWEQFSEWAADDRAVGGNMGASLSLAAALVRVARIFGGGELSPLLTSLVANPSDLSARVERLIEAHLPHENRTPRSKIVAASAILGLTSMVAALMTQSAPFYSVHRLLEHLIR